MGRLGALALGVATDAARGALRRAANGGVEPLLFNAANAERLRSTLAELRGAALKLGQLISLEGEDLLPPELASILASLRDQADAMTAQELDGVLRAELGGEWRSRFTEFDPEPLAAASIGQVHAAVAADGRDLALKVQYPGVEKSIDGDVSNLAALLRLLRVLPPELEIKELVPEIRRELKREADYEREAANTERFRALVEDDPVVFVPRVHRDLSTRRVLALDRVWALPIEDLRGSEHPTERRDRLATALMRLVFRELFEFRFMQTDPNFANYLFEPKQERVALLDFGSARSFPKRFSAAYARLVRAATEGESADVLAAGEALGFLRGDEGGLGHKTFIEIARLFAEPLGAAGPYDFAGSDLARRLRETSLIAYRKRWLSRPPTETLFLHRKLVGSFLLCAHIGARVDAGALYREWLRG
jgi:predicted unusual protein kinase regulating ubiquinone biosynthesis (AarF/ABC1/UbiB family)